MSSVRAAVIGVGSVQRGDDAAGALVAKQLRDTVKPNDRYSLQVIECDGETTALIDALKDFDVAYLVDAAHSNAASGTIVRIEAHREPLPAYLGSLSSHQLGLAQGIELARTLGALPRVCIVFGIEARSFSFNTPPTAEVSKAIDEVALRIRAELTDLIANTDAR
jgi:hydrogenase maturation protease